MDIGARDSPELIPGRLPMMGPRWWIGLGLGPG